MPSSIVAKLQFSDLIVAIAEIEWKGLRRKELAKQLPRTALTRVVVLRGGLSVEAADCSRIAGVSRVAELEVMGLLQETIDRLVEDFGFAHVKMAGEADLNRTTVPVVRVLVWLERTPEAQVALRLAFQRRTGKPPLGSPREVLLSVMLAA